MKNLSISLTPAKCELLDNILNEFEEEVYIKSDRVLKIFRGNGTLASDYLDVLVQMNLVILVGQVDGVPLPAMVGKQAGVDMFISEGGFKRRYALNKLEEDTGKSIFDLKTENLDLKEKVEKQEVLLKNLEKNITQQGQSILNKWLARVGFMFIGIVLTVCYFLFFK
ncbi:hypothetical protein OQZ33_23890 [Pedobacter sp. MC2016-05]|jgi:hypothetical protein|uniref:hypothetical protein n=1 Tax=unclassified Pedobacter TaxID=2628915 RepID=UPI000702D1E1|nr:MULTISPECIES: hypothetical protein [unclassified Pedobacter]KQN35010.1 hypothetical protein ASE92_10300 [Pedobacter sp. Leaf41]MCX2477396.1 hypothetical protein [Pedobacter sp. MC2016-05]RZL68970.1 MAG: hypothetical protein EOO93_02905 [Pedobacter sp.]